MREKLLNQFPLPNDAHAQLKKLGRKWYNQKKIKGQSKSAAARHIIMNVFEMNKLKNLINDLL